MALHSASADLVILDFHGVCFDPLTGDVDPAATALVGELDPLDTLVAVLSNELDDHTIGSTPLLRAVDHVVVCASGIQKPDRRAFERVMMLARVDAGRTVVVDDSPDNVRGARAARARGIWFDGHDRAASWAEVRDGIGLPGRAV